MQRLLSLPGPRRRASSARAQHLTPLLSPALAVLLLAPPVSDQDASERRPEDTSGVTVPFDSEAGWIVLPISINGSEPLPIVLDTGMPAAGIALFDGPHLEALDLEYLSTRARIGGAGGGRSYEARISAGATFEIGDVRIERTQLIVMPPIPYFDTGYAGIIGAELLSRYAVSVDKGAGTVTLTRPDAFEAPDGASAVPLEMIGGMPHVVAHLPESGVDEETIRLVLDLGARNALSLDVSHPAVAVPERAIERQVGRGLSGALRAHVGRLPAIELGGHRLESVVASFSDLEDGEALSGGGDGNLGFGLMNRFDFALDYATKTLYLAPGERFEEPFEADMTGLVLESEDGAEIVVSEVVAGSPASEGGLAVGDRVLSVDGERVSGRDIARLSERFQRAGALTLEVASGKGEPRTVELKLRRLI